MNTSSLRDYYQRNPQLSGTPSISQTGDLRTVLLRIEQRQQRREALRNFIDQAIARAVRSVKSLRVPQPVIIEDPAPTPVPASSIS